MRPKNEKAVCDFVRKILSGATGIEITVTDLPDRSRRSTREVEELWASTAHRFAIEHTLLESFKGQLEDDAKFVRLMVPLEGLLVNRLPGTYECQVEAGASSSAKVRYEDALLQVALRVLEVAPQLSVGEAVALHVALLPFAIRLRRRHAEGSKLILSRSIGDIAPSRLDRVRRALNDKCPKLATACVDGRMSVLALESNDIALANYNVVGLAIKEALSERDDRPDIVVLVETDGGPLYTWVIENRSGISLDFSYRETDFFSGSDSDVGEKA